MPYLYKDCVKYNSNGTFESKTCSHVATPEHSHQSRRTACGCVLMKKQRTKRKVILTPRKVYPYMSVKNSLINILNKPGFLDKCEQWRSRENVMQNTDYLGDVYDGDVWQRFSSRELNNFLCTPYSYLLTINVDWFQPFVRATVYSTGAIYLTIQNLPRHERYLQENLILVSLLPGPSEPKSTMNSYLTPLVEELHELWNGVVIPVKSLASHEISIRIKAALSCCACDIPASRKLCGFLGHKATLGCNKCLKEFVHHPTPSSGNCTDYSGFNRENWPLRNNVQHRNKVDELLKEQTPTSLQQAGSNSGVRYSILLSLPYFDPVKFTVVDLMHNLFLGLASILLRCGLKMN